MLSDKAINQSWFFDFSVLILLFIFWPFLHIISVIYILCLDEVLSSLINLN